MAKNKKLQRGKSPLKVIGIVLNVLLVLGLLGSTIFLVIKSRDLKIKAEEDMASLKQQLAEFGDVKQIYYTKENVPAGTPIDKELLVIKDIPSTMFSTSMVTDPVVFNTTLAKVDIKANSPILQDMLIPEIIYNQDRLVNIVADAFPVGIKKDDFIDYKLITPYGETYTVFSKARVLNVEDNSIQVKLTFEDEHNYNSAIVDSYLNPGTLLTATVYVEPGLQSATEPYYPVSQRVLVNMQNNPNIKNIAAIDLIKGRRKIFEASREIDEDTQEVIVDGRSILVTKLLTDFSTVREREAEEEEAKKQQSKEGVINDNTEIPEEGGSGVTAGE